MSEFSDSNPMHDIPLAPIKETGAVPNERIKDADALRKVFSSLKKADEGSARNRSLVQGMFDGDPPYDDGELRAAGQANRTNLNFGEAEAQLEYAMAGYIDLTQSVENLVSVRTMFGEVGERPEWEEIIADEITRTVRAWPQFHFNTLHLCHHFIAHGLGVAYWPDSVDWRFRGSGLGDFYFPRQTLASEDDLEIAVAQRGMPGWHLYRKIANEDVATEAGWNVSAVKKALAKASSNSTDSDDWMKLEAEFKNNDLGETSQQAEVRVVHGWVREFDNTITHYIISEQACDDKDDKFLYKKRSAFTSMQQVFVLFPFGLGTNALTHGIRGLGHKIFPQVSVSNRLRSDTIDAARLASSLMVKPTTEEALNDVALTSFGSHTILNPDVDIETYTSPNLSYTLIPVLQDMENMMNRRVGSYNSQSALSGGERKTRFEVAAQLEQSSRLSNTSLELFYAPLERVFREVVRRMSRKNYLPMEPGGRELASMRTRILKRGVPLEALYQLDVDATHAVRAIGAGSAAARSIALSTLEDMAPSYDEQGQHNLRRDRTIATVGLAQANRYIPRIANQRPPIDRKLALLENAQLMEGIEIPVLPNELHLVHIEIHLDELNRFYMAANDGTMPLVEAAPLMLGLFNHASEHLSLVGGDPITLSKAADYRQALQQIGEVVTNGLKAVEAVNRKAAAEAEASGQAAPEEQGPSIDDQIKFQKHLADMQRRQEKHELDMNLKIQNAQLQRSLADSKQAGQLQKLLK